MRPAAAFGLAQRAGLCLEADSMFYRGKPRTSEEWAALARIASGYSDVPRQILRELFMLGLVDRQLGRLCLSEHGRHMLGLPADSWSTWTPALRPSAAEPSPHA